MNHHSSLLWDDLLSGSHDEELTEKIETEPIPEYIEQRVMRRVERMRTDLYIRGTAALLRESEGKALTNYFAVAPQRDHE